MNKTFCLLTAACLLALTAGSVLAQNTPAVQAPQAPTVYAAGSKVAVIVVNNSGEKNDSVRNDETKQTATEIDEEMTAHQLTILDDAVVTKAIGTLDLTDEENETKANLYKIGQTAGADLLILAVIQDTGQTSTTTLFDNMRGGWVLTKFWLLDVKQQHPIVNAKAFKGDSRHHAFGFGLTSGRKMQTNAAANAARDAFKDFFDNQAPPIPKS